MWVVETEEGREIVVFAFKLTFFFSLIAVINTKATNTTLSSAASLLSKAESNLIAIALIQHNAK